MRGRIVKALAGFYYVDTGEGIYMCRARGIFKNEGIKPYVGDDVSIQITHEGDMEAVLNEIHERKNCFVRPPIANVGQFAIIVAAAKPLPNTDVIDKFLVNAERAGTDIIMVINKTDIDKKGNTEKLKKIYEGLYPVFCVSGKTGEGTEELKSALAGKRTAFAGASGVGKSTILNLLHPVASAKTGSVSEKTSRGRHTTRHVELFDTDNGGEIFDTPGFTSFETTDAAEDELQHYFPEIAMIAGKCRFDDCRHIAEPDCAVLSALEEGRISESRYRSYLNQLEEIRSRNNY